jgi:hypothetical protein
MNKEQLELWKSWPETQEVLGAIAKEIRDLEEGLGAGVVVDSSSIDTTALNTMAVVGQIRGLKWVLEENCELVDDLKG